MQLSQPALEPHSRVILVEYKLCTHACLLYLSFSLGYILLMLSSRRCGVHSEFPGLRGLLGASFPSRHPCGALLRREFRICFTLTHLYQTYVIYYNNNIRTRLLYLFTWHVLWYLDDSVVYMRDLILAHIYVTRSMFCGTGCYKSVRLCRVKSIRIVVSTVLDELWLGHLD